MTVAHRSRPMAAPSVAAAVTALRARGLRISAARRLVLEALFAADGPVTAEAIAGGLDGRLPASDLASVYRNLDTLDALGLVHHVHMGHAPGRYAVAGRREAAYAACEACGRTVLLAPAALARIRHAVRAGCGLDATFTHFPIVGRCPDCEDEHHAHP